MARNFLEPYLTPLQAKKILTMLLERGRSFPNPVPEAAFETWLTQCQEALRDAFGANSGHVQQFKRASTPNYLFSAKAPEEEVVKNRGIELAGKLQVLHALIIDVLDLKIEAGASEAEHSVPSIGSPKKPQTRMKRLKNADVFIVHGHDEKVKNEVVNVIFKLGHNPVILHEQADSGLAIIDKLLKHAKGAAFAVVILTPDDVGAVVGQTDNLMPRARQNVIFELGLFVGLIGKENVCPLYVPGVEILSDFLGVGYTKIGTDDSWKTKLVKEMRAANLDADANRL